MGKGAIPEGLVPLCLYKVHFHSILKFKSIIKQISVIIKCWMPGICLLWISTNNFYSIHIHFLILSFSCWTKELTDLIIKPQFECFPFALVIKKTWFNFNFLYSINYIPCFQSVLSQNDVNFCLLFFRWLDYSPVGKCIPNTRIVCFKVPLSAVSFWINYIFFKQCKFYNLF